MISINATQSVWIKQIQTKIIDSQSAKFIHYPPSYDGGRPLLSNFYLKPVIALVPHKNFPSEIIKCKFCLTSILKPKGFATNPSARYVHGLHSGSYLLQFRYTCWSCKTTFNSSEVLETMPSYCRSMFPVILSHRSAVDIEVMTYITSDATTA